MVTPGSNPAGGPADNSGSSPGSSPGAGLPPSLQLQALVAEVLLRLDLAVDGTPIPLNFALLQYSGLPDPVFQSAARFAQGVVDGLHLPDQAPLADLLLFRYHSQAAANDWNRGGWAADLSWQILSAFPLAVKS